MSANMLTPNTVVDPRQLLPSGVAAGVHDALKEEFGLEDNEVKATSELIEDFGADEADARGLAWRLGQKLGITIDKSELDFSRLGTVTGLQNFIMMKSKNLQFTGPPSS